MQIHLYLFMTCFTCQCTKTSSPVCKIVNKTANSERSNVRYINENVEECYKTLRQIIFLKMYKLLAEQYILRIILCLLVNC
jgi:hypothetical protein